MSNVDFKQLREDYALQVVPESFRQWSWMSLMSVLLAGTSSMFYLTWGSDLIQAFGLHNFLIGMLILTVFIGTISFLLTNIASETGLDMDLITSGSGFGYKGAGLTSLIYAGSYLIFFALEGSIISAAIHAYFPSMPMWSIYFCVGFVFIPLTWYGITAMNYVMWITLPMYLILIGIVVFLIIHNHHSVNIFSVMTPDRIGATRQHGLLTLLASALPFIATSTSATDVGRFIPKKKRRISTLAMSYGVSILTFSGATLLGVWLGMSLHNSDPGVYLPALIGGWGVLLVVITQIRINVLNTYTGSLALTTFFSRMFGFSPGRHYWVIATAVLSTLLMFGNMLQHLLTILIFQSVFIVAWVASVLSYILLYKNIFKLSPETFRIQKGEIPNYHVVGLSALLISLAVTVPMAFGLFGDFGKVLAPFVAGTLAFVVVLLMRIFNPSRV